MRPSRKSVHLLAACLGSVLASGLSSTALAGKPWFAGPSTIAVGQTRAFNGGGVAPEASLVVRVADPRGAINEDYVIANAEGRIAYEVTPLVDGPHVLSILGLDGEPLARTNFAAY